MSYFEALEKVFLDSDSKVFGQFAFRVVKVFSFADTSNFSLKTTLIQKYFISVSSSLQSIIFTISFYIKILYTVL
jgi:hypothetical protein